MSGPNEGDRADLPHDVAPARRMERRYSRHLHWYPPAWRREHGAALLGTLLDVAQARGGGPTLGEVRDLAVHGLRARLAYLAPQPPTRQLAADLALALGWAIAVVNLVAVAWLIGPGWAPGARASAQGVSALGPLASAEVLVYLPWLLALPAVLLGMARTARAILLSCLAVVPVVLLLDGRVGQDSGFWDLVLGLGCLGLVAALGHPRRSRRRTVHLITGTAAVAVAAALDVIRTARLDEDFQELTDPAGAGNPPAFWLQEFLFEDVVLALVGLCVVALVAAWWRPTWLPAASAVTFAWTLGWGGPVGLFLALVDRGARASGVWIGPGAGPWLVSLGVCVTVAALATVVRWRVGPPVSRR